MEYDLNPEQLEIVQKGDGPVLVVAGPGSGKTRTLVYRVCKVLEDGAPPESVLLLTFTNKAAKEMKSRVEKLVGHGSRITAGTFHSFANILLKRHSSKVGLKLNFTIMDQEDSTSLLKQAVLAEHEKVKRSVVDSISHLISLSKLTMTPLEELVSQPDFFHLGGHIEDIQKIAQKYESKKKAMNLVDFADLLLYAHQLLKDDKLREFYQSKFTNILVDEFQDTDRLQAAI